MKNKSGILQRESYSLVSIGESYQRLTHASGLEILLFPKQTSTLYAILEVPFGSFDETYRIGQEIVVLPRGTAHFMEHQMFETKSGVTVDEFFSSRGAESNAYTSFDKTAYLFSSTEQKRECLQELVRFVTHPYFTKKNVEKERGIIAEELREGLDNPYDNAYWGLMRLMYGDAPISNEVGGSEESISHVTAGVLKRAYRDRYRPDQMVLSIAGDLSEQEVIAAVDAAMADRQPISEQEQIPTDIPTAPVRKEVYGARGGKPMSVTRPIFCFGIKDTDIPATPQARCKKGVAMQMAMQMIFSSSSELSAQMYADGLISSYPNYSYTILKEYAFAMVSGESDEPDAVFDRICRKTEQVAERGFGEEEFLRAKRTFYADYMRDFDSTEEIASAMLDCRDDGVGIFEFKNIIEQTTKEECEETLRRLYREDARAFFTVDKNEKV